LRVLMKSSLFISSVPLSIRQFVKSQSTNLPSNWKRLMTVLRKEQFSTQLHISPQKSPIIRLEKSCPSSIPSPITTAGIYSPSYSEALTEIAVHHINRLKNKYILLASNLNILINTIFILSFINKFYLLLYFIYKTIFKTFTFC